ncbi:N-acetylglucosamine-6-phosphate deacetylase [uncultured Tateyamaria sp.]|uniref:N-acetylglucosamine-6-phosphate deacetylase n=1 Tax=uncultured Tateyamaria sp. TaxID=455651 RepID=UPI00260CCD58|nr:N-acetylglucosamine-6-phosphate deacetylase [uncultured Tateyamaria sp.]
MTRATSTFIGGRVFDGERLYDGTAAQFRDGVFVGLAPDTGSGPDDRVIDLDGDILAPGYVDLQVNGGGGVMFNDDPSRETLARIAEAHRSLGSTAILPTLITDRPDKTTAAIEAVCSALHAGMAGVKGLHLEGPHLSVARKGAHDAALIRPMDDADLQQLLAAKAGIPVLKITIAPESVTPDQVRQMMQAGILVSLGHSDADFETCRTYAKAGASCVTHLFNAMSQLGNRKPGLVGAALNLGQLSAGVIADGIHVHPASLRSAWASKREPGALFLVSDAMAVAGTDMAEFHLDGRRISRKDGRLTLEDGTLAGADLDLTTAVRVLVDRVGIDLADALRAATTVPARIIGLQGGLVPGKTRLTDVNRISGTLTGLQTLGVTANEHHSTGP